MNDKLVDMFVSMAAEIKLGEPPKSDSEAMLAVILLVTITVQKNLNVRPDEVIGALELAKATVLHEWHEILTRSQPGGLKG